MIEQSAGVLGAASMVGRSLLPLLADAGWHVDAFARQRSLVDQCADKKRRIVFHKLSGCSDNNAASGAEVDVAHWVSLVPIWVLPDYFSMLTACRAKRVVALSSTSVFTKCASSDADEKNTANKLRQGEQEFIAWAEANRIEWVILRPTMIYGLGRDRNICEIARFISRFGFFPLFGASMGLRQPVHVEDVALACAAVLRSSRACNQAYNISGAEKLSYREMVARIFRVMGKPERFVNISFFVFSVIFACLKIWPRFRGWSVAMAERMNTDMVFEHADAFRDFGFSPRNFQLGEMDLPLR